METRYEWCYETTDEHGDILSGDFEDKLKDFQDNRKTSQLCLVRNVGDEIDGVQYRSWAYVENGKLPEYFEDGYKVPMRFHQELQRAMV